MRMVSLLFSGSAASVACGTWLLSSLYYLGLTRADEQLHQNNRAFVHMPVLLEICCRI